MVPHYAADRVLRDVKPADFLLIVKGLGFTVRVAFVFVASECEEKSLFFVQDTDMVEELGSSKVYRGVPRLELILIVQKPVLWDLVEVLCAFLELRELS